MNTRSKLATFLLITMIFTSFPFTSGFVKYSFSSANIKTGVTAPAELPLNDARGHWAEAAIAEMYAKNVMNGYRDSSFRPNRPVTFLEAIVLIDRLLDYEPSAADMEADTYLSDVFNLPKWSVGYVGWALRQEILLYSEVQRLAQQQPLTRQEGALLTVRTLQLTKLAKQKREAALPFTDMEFIDQTSRGSVALVLERHIMNGYPDNSFQPESPISRAEMAVLLSNIAKQIPYVNSKELTGFIKEIMPAQKNITLMKIGGEAVKYTLPDRYLLYLNGKPSDLSALSADNYIRVIGKAHETVILVETVAPDTGTPVSTEAVNPEAGTDQVKQWVESNKSSENFLAGVFDKKLYLLATRGEKKTSGYTVNITKVTSTVDEKGTHYRVWLERTDPAPDAIVNQSLTYPYALVRVALPAKVEGTVTFVNQLNQDISETTIP